ncbi:MAG: helix-turn-helix transcriptional regulator [Clostridiales bacterium]|nr:helix-turn-helix transcriptional regulator [Clostridiales bacterium]
MDSDFSRSLSLLRREREVSQRTVARALGISQALLSHYENGVREPGLAFVRRACDYYNVSADFLLGRTMDRDGAMIQADTLYDYSAEKDNVLRGSVMATLSKKLLVNSISLIFGLLGKLGRREAIAAAAQYLSTAVYTLFRLLYRADGSNSEDVFSLSDQRFQGGLADADMICSKVELIDALSAHVKEKGAFPEMDNDTLTREYPGAYQSLLQIFHTTSERINRRASAQGAERT